MRVGQRRLRLTGIHSGKDWHVLIASSACAHGVGASLQLAGNLAETKVGTQNYFAEVLPSFHALMRLCCLLQCKAAVDHWLQASIADLCTKQLLHHITN